jgi:hypothetical protein
VEDRLDDHQKDRGRKLRIFLPAGEEKIIRRTKRTS